MFAVTREFRFESAHRILGHPGKCAFIHGHSYRAEVVIVSDFLDKLGMVIDFSFLKEHIGGWIDQHWDHNLIISLEDPLNPSEQVPGFAKVLGRPPFLMPIGEQPTAENLARYLFHVSQDILADRTGGVQVLCVTVHETMSCSGTYREGAR